VQIGSIEGYTSICEYSIQCNQPSFRFDPNPENSRGEWGPGADTTRYGLEPHEQDGGIIYARDGRAVVAFRSNDPKRIRFRYMLKSFEEPSEDLRDCICYYKSGDLIIFLMKLPHKGKYTLEMYAKVAEPGRKKKRGGQKGKKKIKEKSNRNKDKNSKKKNHASDDEDDDDIDSYESICNYLIKSDVGCYDLAPYPPLNNIYGQTGDVTELNDDDDLCLTTESHQHSVIDPYDKGEMTIVMCANKDPGDDLRAEMVRYHDGEEEDSSNYVMMYKDDLTYTIDLLFPKVGFYKLSLTSGNRLVHQYLINVIEPDTTSGPYPTQGPGWRTGYRLIGTRTGYLEADKKVLIQAKVADARKLKAVCDDGQEVEFAKNNREVWEGEVHTDPKGGGQLRVVMEEERTGKDHLLLIYNVSFSILYDLLRLRCLLIRLVPFFV